VPVISLHAFLGLAGLLLWVSYLLLDQKRLAWATLCVLARSPSSAWSWRPAGSALYRSVAAPGPSLDQKRDRAPERNFPLPVVLIHGVLAVTTLVLVLFHRARLGPA